MNADTIPITADEALTLQDWASAPPTMSSKDAWAALQETGKLRSVGFLEHPEPLHVRQGLDFFQHIGRPREAEGVFQQLLRVINAVVKSLLHCHINDIAPMRIGERRRQAHRRYAPDQAARQAALPVRRLCLCRCFARHKAA